MTLHEWLADWLSNFFPLFVNHLWQATIFTCLGAIAIMLLKRGPARSRYAVWLIIMAKFALPSVLLISCAHYIRLDLAFLLGPVLKPVQSAPIITQVARPVLQVTELPIVEAVSTREHNELYCALMLISVAGMVVMFGQCLRMRKAFRVLISKARRVNSGREIDALNRARSLIGVRQNIALAICPDKIEPGVLGIWKPILLLPETIADYLSDEELEMVILHEVAHISRRDNLASLFQTFISCVFWFHPLVWVISWKLLAERERACDEKTIEISGASHVYASGILKVCRLCIGFQLAGVSKITGSDLKRRIEQIMFNKGNTKLAASHKIIISTVVIALITLSTAAGLLGYDAIAVADHSNTAHSNATAEPSAQEHSGAQQSEGAEKAPQVEIKIENVSGTPVTIISAKINVVETGRHMGASTMSASEGSRSIAPSVLVRNETGQRITGLALTIDHPESGFEYGYEHPALSIEPRGSLLVHPGIMPYIAGDLSRLRAKVIGVRFEDGTSWGKIARAGEAETPPKPPEPSDPPSGLQARTTPDSSGGTSLPTTDASSGAHGAMALPVPPEIPFVSAVTPKSSGESSVAGKPSTVSGPDWPLTKVASEKGKMHRYGGGMLHREATWVVQPIYPTQAKKAGVTGVVIVEVIVDTNGNVEFARVRSGAAYGFASTNNPSLEQAALEAARQWRFKPATEEGVPVKMIGELYFRFR